MKILGVDPGTKRVGYAIFNIATKKLESAGILPITSKLHTDALLEIRRELQAIIKKEQPSLFAIEKLFFVNNQKTGMAVAEARGVILLTALEAGIPVRELAPNEVKQQLTGYGGADKKAVAKMVRLTLRAPELKLIDDAMDAIAISLVAAQLSRLDRASS